MSSYQPTTRERIFLSSYGCSMMLFPKSQSPLSFSRSLSLSLSNTFSLFLRGLSYEVVIVEDNSPDNTLEVAESLREIYGPSKIIIHSRPGKLGLGSAYIDGLKRCSGDFVFLMDADMSHHPRHMPEFIRFV